MSANDAHRAELAAACAAAERPAGFTADVAQLCRQISRLVLALELERLERMGYETGGVTLRRRERSVEIRAELGWLP